MLCLSVQQKQREVEIAREEYPYHIGDLQKSRELILSVKAHRHRDDEDIEQDDPDEGEEPPFQHEEEYLFLHNNLRY